MTNPTKPDQKSERSVNTPAEGPELDALKVVSKAFKARKKRYMNEAEKAEFRDIWAWAEKTYPYLKGRLNIFRGDPKREIRPEVYQAITDQYNSACKTFNKVIHLLHKEFSLPEPNSSYRRTQHSEIQHFSRKLHKFYRDLRDGAELTVEEHQAFCGRMEDLCSDFEDALIPDQRYFRKLLQKYYVQLSWDLIGFLEVGWSPSKAQAPRTALAEVSSGVARSLIKRFKISDLSAFTAGSLWGTSKITEGKCGPTNVRDAYRYRLLHGWIWDLWERESDADIAATAVQFEEWDAELTAELAET